MSVGLDLQSRTFFNRVSQQIIIIQSINRRSLPAKIQSIYFAGLYNKFQYFIFQPELLFSFLKPALTSTIFLSPLKYFYFIYFYLQLLLCIFVAALLSQLLQYIQMSKKKIDWISTLKNYVSTHPQRSAQEIDDETDKLFLNYIEEAKRKQEETDPSFKKVPKFFQKSQQTENPISFKVRQEARNRFLKHKTSQVLDKQDLQQLHQLLRQNFSPPHDNKQRLNYNSFLTVASKLPLKFRHFFSASTFLKFDRDEYGRIDMQSFFHSIVRKNNLFQTRIHISLYDTNGNGYLTENNLKEYITELIPTFSHLKNIEKDFEEKYIIGAIKKFTFFLDPKRTGRVYIKDMLTSPILAQFYQLRQERYDEDVNQNWFSLPYAKNLYNRFNKLDADKNGYLRKQDLAKYSKGLTTIVIDRIYEEYQTYDGQLDYQGFLQFVLAMDNKKSPEALQYFWRILDVYHKGAIDSFIINMFFRSVIQKLQVMDRGGFNVEDIKDEIFDMAKPELPMAITLQDLIKCGQGDIIVSMLIDAKAFYDYDQRENGTTLEVFDQF